MISTPAQPINARTSNLDTSDNNSTPNHTGPGRLSPRRRRIRRAASIASAALAALAIWTISVRIFGVDLRVGSGASEQTIGLASIVIVPLLVGSCAWALLALLERVATRGLRAWRIIAWTALAVSLLGPLSMGATGIVLLSLLTMHLVVGTMLIVGLAGGKRTQ